MLWLARFIPLTIKRPSVALALTLIAAVACADRVATGPQHAPTQRASMDINPSPIDDLWISPHRAVIAGETAIGTLTLAAPVPSGTRIVVRLAHATPFVSFDPILVMPEGATSQSFLVQTSWTPNQLGIAFVADVGGRQIIGNTFTLYPGQTPPPPVRSISVLPRNLAFGPQAVGTSSAPKVDTVRNTGTVTQTIFAVDISGPFSRTSNCPVYPATIAPNQFCTISVEYRPTGAGAQSGSLTVRSSAPTSPDVVTLNGTLLPTAAINVTPTSIGWGAVAVGTATSGRVVKITSTGTAPLVVSSLTLGGTNPGDFSIFAGGCTGASLSPGASCTAYVSFEPLRIGALSAKVTIAHNASGGPVAVSLSGAGVKGGGYIP